MKKIVEHIFSKNIDLQFVWGRSHFTPKKQIEIDDYYDDGFTHYHYTKQFKKVKKQGYDLKRVLMFDNTLSKVANSYGNAIYIKEFKGEKDDKRLFLLSQYLLTLKDIENVRVVEKRNWNKIF